MTKKSNFLAFIEELKQFLPTSTSVQRDDWAQRIVKNDWKIRDLSFLLQEDPKTATRFLWLLTHVGQTSPEKLCSELPYLFAVCEAIDSAYLPSFATFWSVAGIPEEQEGRAVDVLFDLIRNPKTTVTIKSRALIALAKLISNYPELQSEWRICLEEQQNQHSATYRKRVRKWLIESEMNEK